MGISEDEFFMREALKEAKRAQSISEVPVGAVIVLDGKVIARGSNCPISTHDPTNHAEISALRKAGQVLENYRLLDCSLYVTLEPCAMCTGAIFHARLKEVVFGARDPKTGVAGSVVDLYAEKRLNHHTAVRGGVLEKECGSLLQDFFAMRRAQSKSEI